MAHEMVAAEGTIREVLPERRYRVELDNGSLVLVTVAARFRRDARHILVGDRVELDLSPFDLTRGRIVGRVG